MCVCGWGALSYFGKCFLFVLAWQSSLGEERTGAVYGSLARMYVSQFDSQPACHLGPLSAHQQMFTDLTRLWRCVSTVSLFEALKPRTWAL